MPQPPVDIGQLNGKLDIRAMVLRLLEERSHSMTELGERCSRFLPNLALTWKDVGDAVEYLESEDFVRVLCSTGDESTDNELWIALRSKPCVTG